MKPIALNKKVIDWYRKKCSRVSTKNVSKLKGNSITWFGYGCHTSRLHNIPDYNH